MDLPDDFCSDLTSTTVKVARKFQPKGSLQEKYKKSSKPSTSITDSGEHVADVPLILSSASALINKSPPNLPSPQAATRGESNQDDDDVNDEESALPSDSRFSNYSLFGPSPTVEGDENQKLPSDSDLMFDKSTQATFHSEPELPNSSVVSATNTEQPICRDAQPFDDALSKSNWRCDPPPSNIDLPDDFCFDPTSAAVKVTRKFQPKGSLQGKSKKCSKPSASITDSGGEHVANVSSIPSSASILMDKSTPDLPSSLQFATNDERDQDGDDVLGDSLPNNVDLPDDFCFNLTSTTVTRKFQPKGSLQEKSKKISKPSTSTTDSGEHIANDPLILSSASILIDKSPPNLPSPQAATHVESNQDDFDNEDGQPFDDAFSKSNRRYDPPPSNIDLHDDFCFDPTSTAVKVTRKFQPKGSLQEKSKIRSKSSASITDSGGEHAADVSPIPSSPSILTDKSPPDLPSSPQCATNDERDQDGDDVPGVSLQNKLIFFSKPSASAADSGEHVADVSLILSSTSILIEKSAPNLPSPQAGTYVESNQGDVDDEFTQESAQPSDSRSLNYSLFGPRPTIGDDEHQEFPSDPALKFDESIQTPFHSEPGLPNSNVISATNIEQPIFSDAQAFDDALSKLNVRCDPPSSDMDLSDDFCFDPTSTTVKVTRKFQPKGSSLEKSQKCSKPSASITDGRGEHVAIVPPIPSSASILMDKSPLDLPSSQQCATNDERDQDNDDVLEESAQPSDLRSLNCSLFGPSPTLDASPFYEEPHFLSPYGNEHQEFPSDPDLKFDESAQAMFHSDATLPNSSVVSATNTEQQPICTDAQPFDDALSKSNRKCDPPPSDMDLPDDFCFDPNSIAGKVSRKFQPKGPLQEKSQKYSKPSASIADSRGEHSTVVPPIPSSASVLTDKSPPDLPSFPQSATNDERDQSNDDIPEESAMPVDLKSLNYSLFGSSPTIDASPHFLSPQDNEHREIPKDPACELDESSQATLHAEPELPHSNVVSAAKTERPICGDGEPFDDTLSESIASIARGVGKFHLKPRMGGLVAKSNQQRKLADKVGDEDHDVNEEDLGNFDSFRIHGVAEKISGFEKASQNSHMNKKPSRKRKKVSHESNKTPEDPPKKKFVHSTRRKRRQVDKSLLEMPEEEIDSRKLRIRDLIMLTEARERTSIKSGSTGISENNPSNNGHNSRSYYDDQDDAYLERQDPDYEGEDANAEVDASSIKLNYHTYMKKSRKEKWSKMDVELLYKAIRQFGTDFGMIQQLFPGRTRHQVRLKFKSEERKHPLQIADALVYRSKDHSHFKQVIEQLKVKAEKEKTEELASEHRDEATALYEDESIKSLDGEDQEMNDMYDDGSAVKYDYTTEEAFDWDGYEYNY